MTIVDDNLGKLATENAAGPAAEAMKALERDSAVAAIKAVQSTVICDEIDEMPRQLRSIEARSNLAVALRDLESPVVKAAREFALSQSSITEAVRTAVHSQAAKMSELRASVASDFVSKFAAVDLTGIAKQFSVMQAALGTSVTSKLLEASRSLADQWSATLKEPQRLMQDRMAEIGKLIRTELRPITTLQTSLDRGLFKELAAISSINKNIFEKFSAIDATIGSGLSQRFEEMSGLLGNSFTASAAQAALAFSQTLPQFDERIAEAMREFKALGNLQAGNSTIAGAGTVVESPVIVSARGERHAADAPHAEPIKRPPIELWWERLPIELKFFFLVILFILKSMSEEIIHEHVKDWTGAHSRQDKQVVYDHVTQNSGEETARRLRCIRASMLRVRQEASASGNTLDSLPRGTPVEVLESQGGWSRIRYRVPNSSSIREGWAASGYLSFEIC